MSEVSLARSKAVARNAPTRRSVLGKPCLRRRQRRFRSERRSRLRGSYRELISCGVAAAIGRPVPRQPVPDGPGRSPRPLITLAIYTITFAAGALRLPVASARGGTMSYALSTFVGLIVFSLCAELCAYRALLLLHEHISVSQDLRSSPARLWRGPRVLRGLLDLCRHQPRRGCWSSRWRLNRTPAAARSLFLPLPGAADEAGGIGVCRGAPRGAGRVHPRHRLSDDHDRAGADVRDAGLLHGCPIFPRASASVRILRTRSPPRSTWPATC